MKLIIASNNAHKIAEIKAILGSHYEEILSLQEAEIEADVVEDADTFEGNALKKANEIFDMVQADAVLSDDSGLEVDALNGAPGVYSARYAGTGHDDRANNEKILANMKDIPEDKRTCRFVSAVALVRKGKRPIVVRGTVEGMLLHAPQGDNGFGYDPLFFYEPLNRSFAELTSDEKNAVSHRKRALEALSAELEREK